MLSLRLLFPGDTRAVLGEGKLTDLNNMDHYLTVRHFTVPKECKPLVYIMMLGDTSLLTLNAATLRTFKKLGLRFFVLEPFGPSPLKEGPFCPYLKDFFLTHSAFVMQWAL